MFGLNICNICLNIVWTFKIQRCRYVFRSLWQCCLNVENTSQEMLSKLLGTHSCCCLQFQFGFFVQAVLSSSSYSIQIQLRAVSAYVHTLWAPRENCAVPRQRTLSQRKNCQWPRITSPQVYSLAQHWAALKQAPQAYQRPTTCTVAVFPRLHQLITPRMKRSCYFKPTSSCQSWLPFKIQALGTRKCELPIPIAGQSCNLSVFALEIWLSLSCCMALRPSTAFCMHPTSHRRPRSMYTNVIHTRPSAHLYWPLFQMPAYGYNGDPRPATHTTTTTTARLRPSMSAIGDQL
jgi:hypothetical protein